MSDLNVDAFALFFSQLIMGDLMAPPMTEDERKFAASFDWIHGKGAGESQVLHRCFADVWGPDEHLTDLHTASFITKSELELFSTLLALQPQETLLDIGCGLGGPGLWIARKSNANLIGTDLSRVAVEKARQAAEKFSGFTGHADFKQRPASNSSLDAESIDGAMAIDVIGFAKEEDIAREVFRVLKSGRVFAFTAWLEQQESGEFKDMRPIFEAAGFEVVSYQEPAGWREPCKATYQLWLDREQELVDEVGRDIANALLGEARQMLPLLDTYQRLIVAVGKPG
jgi:SAM-dependent methyltransferase